MTATSILRFPLDTCKAGNGAGIRHGPEQAVVAGHDADIRRRRPDLPGFLSSLRPLFQGRGNSTWGMPKKPYSLKLKGKTSLLGMPAHKRWNLLANYSDKTLLRTEVAFKIGETLEDGLQWTPRSRHLWGDMVTLAS